MVLRFLIGKLGSNSYYFQSDGKGTLKMDNGSVFVHNDTYELDRETFRLYYTSECTDQQAIDITVMTTSGRGTIFQSRSKMRINFFLLLVMKQGGG